MTASRPSKATLNLVWARDQSRCFNCCRVVVRGQGGYSIHHRIPRGMGGTDRPEINLAGNLILLCGSGVNGCHGYIESKRRWAVEAGLLVPWWNADPAQVPILRWRTSWILLDNAGEFRPAGSVETTE